MKNILIIYVLLLNLTSCKKELNSNKKKVEINKIDNMSETKINSQDSIKNILEQQVMHGYAIKEKGFDMVSDYIYKKEDYNAIKYLSADILKSNNYKLISDEDFQSKVLKIFNFKNKSIDTNFLIEFVCPLDKTKYLLDLNYTISNNNPLFIDPKNNMILEALFIPQLINYKIEFSDIYSNEEKVEKQKSINGEFLEIIKWKDITELDKQRKKNIQILVARNMYLFNDSKAHFRWLVLNDEYFMASLVKTFGYYEDNQLNSWVSDKTEFSNKNIEEVNKVIYNKKCDGKIVLNYPLLEIISENEEKESKMYDFFRFDYFDWLLDNKNNIELTFSQKAEIIARVHSFIFSNMKDYRTVDYMGKFAEYNDSDNKYSKEFEKHNYYKIPNFKKQWQEAKEDGDGVSLPGEE